MERLAGKVPIVTGGSQGIGLAIARAFAREGAARNLAAETGGRVVGVQADVAQRENVRRTIAVAADRFGRIDILVNNAQATRQAKTEDITDASIAFTFGSGLFGTLYHMQDAFPYLRDAADRSSTSVRGKAFTGSRETASTAPTRRVSAACRDRRRVSGAGSASASTSSTPPRSARPQNDHSPPIAVFLASEDGRHATGQTINADGGQIML